MGNYITECPSCHKAIQVSTGLFAKKKIQCSCGFMLNAAMEKMAEETCSHCGNTVVYDRSKANTAKCPVCHTRIKSGAEKTEFSCPSCKTSLTADKNAATYTCPLCKVVIDVQARLAQINSSKTAQVVKWDMGLNDIFIYRHPAENFKIGSQLIVTEGQKAIFFRNGQALDIFGPGRYTLETQNLPLLEEVLQYPTDADLTFDSQVYFIRTNRLNVPWGIPNMELRNPGMNFYVQAGASGSADIEVIDGNENYRKLLAQVIGASSGTNTNMPQAAGQSYSAQYLADKFSDHITSRLGSYLADIITSSNINILDLASKKAQLSDMLIKDYNMLLEEYGLVIPPRHFMITNIKIKETPEVEAWRRQEVGSVLRVREEEVLKAEAQAHQARVLVEEQTEAQKRILRTQGAGEERKITAQADADATRIEAQGAADATILTSRAAAEATKLTGQAAAEAYKAQAIAEAEEMQAKNYTYAQETSRQIGLEALQNGLPGTGNSGSSSVSGIGNALGDMVGLGVGLSALGGVVNMTKDIVSPIAGQLADIGKQPIDAGTPQTNLVSGWNCACGKSCNTSKFCPDCGSPKPVTADGSVWNCSCGQSAVSSNFCPNCGSKRG